MFTTDRNETDAPQASPTSSRSSRLGIVLILLSGVFWFSIFAVPFAPLSTGQKTIVAGGLFVAVQVSWWTGAALAGPKVVGMLKGWFVRKSRDDEQAK